MSPIEEHLVTSVARDLAVLGVADAEVVVLSAEAEDWRFRVTRQDRTIEFGFSHRELLWCRETTPGQEKTFVSNNGPKIGASAEARRIGIQLVARALTHPTFVVRDPPVI